ncbi:hypothetical protein [Halorubellus litoreus]|uniref:Uncharacterized protein n=1 Tax=Halorubellus litoreus TaxID=755308 RepID=A0ABD5VP87_9EURY
MSEARAPLDPADRAPLDVAVDLDVSVDDTPVAVASTGDRLSVDFPTVRAAVRAVRRRPALDYREVDALLRAADVALEVRVRHRTVLALGADTRASLLLRRVGVEPVELRLGGVASALVAGAAAAVDRVRRFAA